MALEHCRNCLCGWEWVCKWVCKWVVWVSIFVMYEINVWENEWVSEWQECQIVPKCDQKKLLKFEVWNWPSGKFDCQKIAKNLTFFFNKIDKNCHYFQQNCHWQFWWKKMTIFVNFFLKKMSSLAIFWQSNGNFPEGQVWSRTDDVDSDNMWSTGKLFTN